MLIWISFSRLRFWNPCLRARSMKSGVMPWIRALTARAFSLSPQDWLASATWGAVEAIASGVTCIGDCTFSGAALAGAKALGLRGVLYQEVFGIDESRSIRPRQWKPPTLTRAIAQ